MSHVCNLTTLLVAVNHISVCCLWELRFQMSSESGSPYLGSFAVDPMQEGAW